MTVIRLLALVSVSVSKWICSSAVCSDASHVSFCFLAVTEQHRELLYCASSVICVDWSGTNVPTWGFSPPVTPTEQIEQAGAACECSPQRSRRTFPRTWLVSFFVAALCKSADPSSNSKKHHFPFELCYILRVIIHPSSLVQFHHNIRTSPAACGLVWGHLGEALQLPVHALHRALCRTGTAHTVIPKREILQYLFSPCVTLLLWIKTLLSWLFSMLLMTFLEYQAGLCVFALLTDSKMLSTFV